MGEPIASTGRIFVVAGRRHICRARLNPAFVHRVYFTSSKGKIRFQSFFMLMTFQPLAFASS
jgi:hypothetical protein